MATSQIRQDVGKDHPFPAKQLLILGLCRLSEPIAFISIVSYNFAMVKDIKGPENASFYAGLLVSAFAMAEATTAVVWGALSDRIGRKPVILMGLTGTIISSLVFGFATNYWVALLARFLGGLLNGNVAVLQTMVAEVVKDPRHEPRAYSIQPFAWSLGSIIGSALGGYAAQPARFYPEYFSANGVFGKFPYLLPNLIASVCIFIAILQAAVFLEETNPQKLQGLCADGEIEQTTADERTPLFKPGTNGRNRRPSYASASLPTLTEPNFDVRRPSFAGSIVSFKNKPEITLIEDCIEDDQTTQSDASTTSDVVSGAPMLWVIAIALMSFHQMAFMSVFPIFILDSPQKSHGLDLTGGLGLTVHDTGRYMTTNSLWSLVVQLLILPVFMQKLGLWRTILSLTFICPFVDILMSLITAWPRPDLAVYFVFALQAFCNIIIYPSLLIMLKNATPRRKLGRINGLAVSASSTTRMIAPPLIGIVYSWLGSAGAWWTSALVAGLALLQLCLINRSAEMHEETADDRASSGQAGV